MNGGGRERGRTNKDINKLSEEFLRILLLAVTEGGKESLNGSDKVVWRDRKSWSLQPDGLHELSIVCTEGRRISDMCR